MKVVGNSLLIANYGILGAALAGNIAMVVALAGIVYELKREWPEALAGLSFYAGLVLALVVMTGTVVVAEVLLDAVVLDALPSRLQALGITLISVTLGVVVFLTVTMKRQLLSLIHI